MPATFTDAKPASRGWFWKQTHWDNYVLTGPAGEVLNFRNYLLLCWFCGSKGINAQQS